MEKSSVRPELSRLADSQLNAWKHCELISAATAAQATRVPERVELRSPTRRAKSSRKLMRLTANDQLRRGTSRYSKGDRGPRTSVAEAATLARGTVLNMACEGQAAGQTRPSATSYLRRLDEPQSRRTALRTESRVNFEQAARIYREQREDQEERAAVQTAAAGDAPESGPAGRGRRASLQSAQSVERRRAEPPSASWPGF